MHILMGNSLNAGAHRQEQPCQKEQVQNQIEETQCLSLQWFHSLLFFVSESVSLQRILRWLKRNSKHFRHCHSYTMHKLNCSLRFVKIKFLLSQKFERAIKESLEMWHVFLSRLLPAPIQKILLNILVKWGFWCQHFFSFLLHYCCFDLMDIFYGLSFKSFSSVWFMRVYKMSDTKQNYNTKSSEKWRVFSPVDTGK